MDSLQDHPGEPAADATAADATKADATTADATTADTTATADRANLLRRHGVQVTAQRLAVLKAVSTHPHTTAAEIAATVRDEIGAVSQQAVYDSLAALADRHIIRRIQPAGSPARYEGRVGDNHHHLICRTCERMVDVDCAVGEAPCLTAADAQGYEIDEAEVVYWGRCPECLAAAAPDNR